MTSTLQITLGAWNVEAENPEMLGQSWAGVLGTEVDAYGGMAYLPPSGPGGVAMMFQPLRGSRPERQIGHLDLRVPWGTRAGEVQRIDDQWDHEVPAPFVKCGCRF